mgnify:CR=1 FL=1
MLNRIFYFIVHQYFYRNCLKSNPQFIRTFIQYMSIEILKRIIM